MKILTLAQHDKHQKAKQSAEDVAHFCHFCQALDQISSKLPAGFAYSKRLGKGHHFPTKKISNKLGPNRFFFFFGGGFGFGEGVSINFLAEILDDFLPFVGVSRFWPRLFDLQPGEPGNCPSGLPSEDFSS